MKYLKGKTFVILAIAVIATVFVFYFLTQISVGLKTIGVTVNLLIPKGDWRPLEIFTKKPIQEEHLIESLSNRMLTIHLYRPKSLSQKPQTVMVINSPFIEKGLDDPRLVNLAQTFARAGFVVAVPLADKNRLVISKKDIEDVVATVLFLKEKPEFNAATFGLFGISYGNGPVIAAAADERIRELVRFIISFGGYYDLQNTLEFIQTGRYAYKDIQGVLEPDPYTRKVLDATLDYYQTDEETFRHGSQFAELKRELSPSVLIDQLTADFFITHSTDDPYIPYTESIQLADALLDRGIPVTFSLTGIFEHGTYKKLNLENIRRLYLPTVADFYSFIYTLLAKHL